MLSLWLAERGLKGEKSRSVETTIQVKDESTLNYLDSSGGNKKPLKPCCRKIIIMIIT